MYVNILEPVRGLCFSVIGEVVLLVTLSRYVNEDFSFIFLAFLVASQLDHLRDKVILIDLPKASDSGNLHGQDKCHKHTVAA